MSYPDNPIPEVFYAFSTGAPFENCLVCNRSLLYGDVHYSIEKRFRGYKGFKAFDIPYEYAICKTCSSEFMENISPDSLHEVSCFLHEKGLSSVQPEASSDIEFSLSRCIVYNTSIQDLSSFSIYASFIGNRINKNEHFYTLGDKALHQIMTCLSTETKQEIDFFFEEFLSGSGEVAELMNSIPFKC